MPRIEIELLVNAPVERVFDLARCIDLHIETMSGSKEKAIAGKTDGLIGNGETVTWQAIHFGINQKLTSKITRFERPHYFQDTMQKGAFKKFTHDHFFEETDGKTLMLDVFDYASPFWIFGKIADALFLEKYMTRIFTERNLLIKDIAESEKWKDFLK